MPTSLPSSEGGAFSLIGSVGPEGEPTPIRSLEDWRVFGAPKGGDAQWVDLRSAKELARAWTTGGAGVAPPPDFVALLGSHPALAGLTLLRGYAERKTALRGERRGPRVHDLLLVGVDDAKPVVIGVEAKADEAFDQPLRDKWRQAQEKLRRHPQGDPATRWPERLGRLVPALTGEPATLAGELNPAIAGIPYQLLSALAGTVIEADEHAAAFAVLAAHVFTSPVTNPEVVEFNYRTFCDFVARVGNIPADTVRYGQLYGPYKLPGAPGSRIPDHIPVLLGIAKTDLSG